MRLQHWMASALVALGVASCGENSPPPQTAPGQASTHTTIQQQQQAQAQSQAPRAAPVSATAPRQAVPVKPVIASKHVIPNDQPVPPADAQWTIYCDSVDGVEHVERARMMRSQLVQMTGMHDWYVVHGEKDSKLYYGYYRSLDNAKEKARAEADRLKIVNMTDHLGNRLVRGGVLEPVSLPDPVAPPEWNVLNTPKNAYWSIEIATFSGNPKRKEAAVQMVRELREHGETEAYYYHGETSSSVLIGAWPREAVAEQGTGIDKNGNMRDDAHTQRADQPLLVFTDIAPNVASRVLEPGTGKPMTVMAPKVDIQDADMKAKVKDYPYHSVNYEYHGVEHDGQTFPDPSVLIVIPHEEGAGSDDNWRLTGGAPLDNSAATASHAPSGAAGDSVLRSIGDH